MKNDSIITIEVNRENAATLRHALEVAQRRGTYTDGEQNYLQSLVDDILLAQLNNDKRINEVVWAYGQNWLIREARSLNDAMNTIAMAVCRGSVGGRELLSDNGVESVLADVVALNKDGSERKAS